MRNIEDWCISRQIWWGHRIPAWYDEAGGIYVARTEQEARSKYRLGADITLRQDDDVLDTWFSSALWPFSTLGWPQQTPDLKTFYPTSVLVTGFDIIFFWVARMIMMGLKFMGEVPFREVYIHGLVRDSQGQKMSKSKGNILDPIDLIDGIGLESLLAKRSTGLMQPHLAEKIDQATRKEFPHGILAFGTDALRFTFAALASTGRDIKFDLGRIEGYRNFCNKLWNAARYVEMHSVDKDTGLAGGAIELTLADRWIITRLQHTERAVAQALDDYRFDLAAQALYEFTWNAYCDWYVELTKPVLLAPDSKEPVLRATRRTLVRVLETLLRLMHPIMPFITEEIWQRVGPLAGRTGSTVQLQAYPRADETKIDAVAAAEMEWLMRIIVAVRTVRAEMNIPPAKKLPVYVQHATAEDQDRLLRHRLYLTALAKLENITCLGDQEQAPDGYSALADQLKIIIPLAGLIDTQAELARLHKAMDKLQRDLEKSRTKLANPDYLARAPEAVVMNERQSLAAMQSSLARLQEQTQRLQSVT